MSKGAKLITMAVL